MFLAIMKRIIFGLAALLGAADSVLAAGDAQRGADLYAATCSACHAPDEDGAGPCHRGLFGRQAGSAPGFDYSDALRQAGFHWDERLLDAWLADPEVLLPGQRMDLAIEDAQDRADLIAYLKTLHP